MMPYSRQTIEHIVCEKLFACRLQLWLALLGPHNTVPNKRERKTRQPI
jgi:hypothetical protein